ncbi:hypothetical protein Cni_G12903 [Canna indica]|uniref:Protein kinase domain-containing protein n=1 Tax=Canna indica TaxID=4628 RepID=A0AAQ3K9C1_9LILI|nr:hypothetical protein Cni_G12903 [Canna indica]
MAREKEVWPLLTLLLSLCLHLNQCRAGPKASPSDSSVMWELARGLSGLPASWQPDSDPCEWDGITCSAGRITGISLASRGVSGSLPASLSSLDALTSLHLQRNRLTGPLPRLSNLSSLQSVSLDDNDFNSLPDGFFAGLTALQILSLDNLPLAPWNLSRDLDVAVGLAEMSATNSSLSGTLPDFIGSLPNLRLLRLSYNYLTGTLPSSLAGSGIQQLLLNTQLSADKLSGGIDVVGKMPQLTVLWLHSNSFTGPIPDLSNLTALESLNLRDNALTGVIPDSLIASTTLNNASLSHNLLQGPFPEFASKSVTLDVIKSNNFCKPTPGPCSPQATMLLAVAAGFRYPALLAKAWSGDDPCGSKWLGVTCDAQNNVIALNFANQRFEGVISPAIANITSLRRVILSNNNLVGPIPESLTKLPQLEVLDVTNNNISGKVPAFPDSVSLKLDGNPRIGMDDDESSIAGIIPFGGSKSSRAALIAGLVIGVLVLVACSVVLCLRYRRKQQEKKLLRLPTEQENFKIGLNGLNISIDGFAPLNNQNSFKSSALYSPDSQSMHMSSLALRRATDNFSEDNILGRGGFGVVYRGDYNGMMIAVKKNEYDIMGKKGQEEFKAEIDVLRKVKHKNLVALIGYCDDGHERLLVYEYMPRGTLGEHLFEWQSRNEPPLTWKQRLTIALDVARGIEYLHSLAQESFIHRDMKPSNILLDKDLRAKVSDFGLVKLANDNQKSMMTRLAGTFGYLAPEYATTGKVTTKIDVYAFGVILMELITGRKVLDESLPPEDCNLVALFRRRYPHEKENFLKSIVDQVVVLDEEAHQSLAEVADLAWHSTAREPHQRPDMSHAVNRLAPLVEQWKPTNSSETSDEDEDDDGDSSVGLPERFRKWESNDSMSATFGSTFK